jgi:hypothetical protein
MLWNAQISRVKKFFLIMLFSGGIFVIMAGILRVYFILTGGREGGAEAAYWGTREVSVAFVIGNVPMIYGGVRIWLRQVRNSKLYGTIRSRTKNWPGVDGFSALFSRVAVGSGRKRTASSSEKPAPSKKFAMQSYTETSNSNSSSDPSRSSPVPWGHESSARRPGTNARRGDLSPAEMDSQFGIYVSRGIKVDVESVRSRESDPETVVEIGGGSKHYRTDSETPLGPFLLDSPPHAIHARISELPSEERQRRERRSMMFVPPLQNPTQRQGGSPDGPNLTKWISDDRSTD